MLQGNVNDKWVSFKKILHELEARHVPINGSSQRRKKSEISHKAVKLIGKKHSVYAKYKTVIIQHILKRQKKQTRRFEDLSGDLSGN